MGLLDWKKSPLARLKARDWTSEEERLELFRQVTARNDLRPKEIVWTLTASEVEIRQLGGVLVSRFNGPDLADVLFDELLDRNHGHGQQRLLIRHIGRCDAGDVLTIASRLFQDVDKNRRAMGAELVNSLPLAKAMGLVKDLLKDPSPEVRTVGLGKLLEDPRVMEDKDMRGIVLGMAHDADERIRMSVYRTVAGARARHPALTALLVKGVKDDSYNVQQVAVQALGGRIKAGDADLEAGLIELLADGSTSVRTAVIKALLEAPDRRRVIRSYLAFTRGLAGWVRERALESLKAFARDLVDPIIELMHDPDSEIRLLAMVVGGNIEDPRCVPPIIELVEGSDWWTRVTAAETLGRIGDRRAVPVLIKLLDDPEARWSVIEALSNLKDVAALGPLSSHLRDPSPEIRLAVLEAISEIGGSRPEIFKVIEARARTDESRAVRERALELLRRLDNPPVQGSKLVELEAMARQSDKAGHSAIEQMLIEVRNMGGSDLHLSVGLPPTLRMHGELRRLEGDVLDAESIERMVHLILTEQQQEVLSTALQLDFCYNIENVGRYRANVFLQRRGLGATFRVIPGIIPTLQDIGMPGHMADLVNYHQGLIVVAGPSGSGKSTTLAALVNLFNERKRAHILTIEDPVEFVHSVKNCLVNQREVGKHTQTFANALRGGLREDPDIIVVGEMRDNETMRLALEAAETGHLVIATLNTTTAPKTVDRLIESFPPNEQAQVRMTLSESLKAIICQNLLPRRDGKGRVALFEILLGNANVRSMVRDNKTYQLISAMQIGRSHGMRTVDMSLQELLQDKLIAGDQAYLRAQDKKLFEPHVSPGFLREMLNEELAATRG